MEREGYIVALTAPREESGSSRGRCVQEEDARSNPYHNPDRNSCVSGFAPLALHRTSRPILFVGGPGPGVRNRFPSLDHNDANEVGTIGATTGTNWGDPVHDAAGNMTISRKGVRKID